MYCTKCGRHAEDNFKFCATCGELLGQPDRVDENAPFFKPVETSVNHYGFNHSSAINPFPEPPVNPAKFTPQINITPPEKEKIFFGKGALLFCLAVIAVLSILTGVFAGLYLREHTSFIYTTEVHDGQYR